MILKKFVKTTLIVAAISSSILVGCVKETTNEISTKEDLNSTIIELLDNSGDSVAVEKNMNLLFEGQGSKYDYTYEDNIIKLTIPNDDIEVFKSRLKQNIEDYINQMTKEGYVNSIEINDNYTECSINLTKDGANDEIITNIIRLLATESTTYQALNGILAKNSNFHAKIYIEGQFNQDFDLNMNEKAY